MTSAVMGGILGNALGGAIVLADVVTTGGGATHHRGNAATQAAARHQQSNRQGALHKLYYGVRCPILQTHFFRGATNP